MRISDWSSDVCSSDLLGGKAAVDQGGDDLAECRADHHRDRQVQHVAARDEFLELADHPHVPSPVVDRIRPGQAYSVTVGGAMLPCNVTTPSRLETKASPGCSGQTPAGVPMNTRSPASSLSTLDRSCRRSGTVQTRSVSAPCWRRLPLTDSDTVCAARPPTSAAGTSSLSGAEWSKALPVSQGSPLALAAACRSRRVRSRPMP